MEATFGEVKLNKHSYTCVGVRQQKLPDGSVQLDQDEYIKTMRPIVHPDLTGSKPEDRATKPVADQFVSLRGALAYATITQAWIQVYVVSRLVFPALGD